MITNKKECYGCNACAEICPYSAITMQENEQGFFYPQIDKSKCTNCNLCEKVCPIGKAIPNNVEACFAIKTNNENVREKSTSGGAFSLLSDEILNVGGAVYGAVYLDDFSVKHIRAISEEDRDKMRGSKYVQSNINGVFASVENDLRTDLFVLFTGTPCQIHGLYEYLKTKKINTDKLVLCQLICHAAPSQKVFKSHIHEIERRRGKKVISYYNRSKVKGWHEHNEMIVFDDGSVEHQSKLSQNAKDLFYGDYSVRESCFICPYAGKTSFSDVMIGDFWGVDIVKKDIDDNKGLSIVFIGSENARNLIDKIIKSGKCDVTSIEQDKALKYNHHRPVSRPALYDVFWDDYNTLPFFKITAKYAADRFPENIKYAAKKRLRRFLVRMKIISS